MADKMTETQVLGLALAHALKDEPTSFGASHAATALAVVSRLAKADKCDDATADRVRVRLGNHSAMRQWCVQHGFIVAPADALSNEVSEQIAALKESEQAELDKLDK